MHFGEAGTTCQDAPDLWFDGSAVAESAAVAACAGCLLREACREESRDIDRVYGYWGVWGGMTARQRRREDEDAASEADTA